ncbi:hypothetical protein D3C85_1641190 [compost metagenome]
MAEQVQQRTGKGHADDKGQTVIPNTQRADLLLPLLQGAGLIDRRQLGAGLVKVKVLGMSADLLFW